MDRTYATFANHYSAMQEPRFVESRPGHRNSADAVADRIANIVGGYGRPVQEPEVVTMGTPLPEPLRKRRTPKPKLKPAPRRTHAQKKRDRRQRKIADMVERARDAGMRARPGATHAPYELGLYVQRNGDVAHVGHISVGGRGPSYAEEIGPEPRYYRKVWNLEGVHSPIGFSPLDNYAPVGDTGRVISDNAGFDLIGMIPKHIGPDDALTYARAYAESYTQMSGAYDPNASTTTASSHIDPAHQRVLDAID